MNLVVSMGQTTATAVTDGGLFMTLAFIGTVAFAVSGAMAAARAQMDWLGALVLAVVVAIGGGTLRDLLLGQLPVSWLERSWSVLAALATGAVVLVVLRVWPRVSIDASMPILIADAAGLSAFVILGTQIGLAAQLAPFLAVVLGVLSGVGGGVIRDLLTGNKPVVLVGQLYAVAGIVGAVVFVAIDAWGVNPELSVWLCVVVILAIRVVAIRRDWHLPRALPGAGDQA